MQQKRPKAIIVLMVVFIWAALRGVQRLATGSSNADRILFDQIGAGWIAPAGVLVVLILDLAAIWYLFRPRPVGLIISLTSIGLSAAETTAATLIGRAYPDALRHAMIVSRESRGLPVREGALEMAQDPTISLFLLCGSLAVSALLAFLVVRNRTYFASSSASSGVRREPQSG